MHSLKTCRICGAGEFEHRFTKNEFRIEKCRRCGLMQITNRLESAEIDALYDQEFFDDAYHRLQVSPKRQDYEFKKADFRLARIEELAVNTDRILDVGCAFGHFLVAAEQRGWKPAGVEISRYAAEYARERFGLNVVEEPLSEAGFKTESFDVLTMWNVIEHLDDPVTEVKTVFRLLKPGGLFVFTTGDVESLLAKLQRGNWRLFIPPIHLSFFSPATIKHLLETCNLYLIKQTYALPYEFLLHKLGLLGIVRRLNISDKMLVYAQKGV